MAPPWEMPKPKRRRSPGSVTSNALVSGIVSAVVAGAISLGIAHYQSQDAARQAISAQQVAAVVRLEADARAFVDVANSTFAIRRNCLTGLTSSCKKTSTEIIDGPLLNPELTLNSDFANVSDSTAKKDVNNLTFYALYALSQVTAFGGPGSGTSLLDKMNHAYSELITRCGQLIQGQQ